MNRSTIGWMIALGLSTALQAATPEELAKNAAVIIGIGADGNCSSCHAVNSEATFTRWAKATSRVETCLLESTAAKQLACIGQTTTTGITSSTFTLEPQQLGIFAAGLNQDPLTSVIKGALGESKGTALLNKLSTTALMPLRSPTHLSTTQFAGVRNWFSAGLPHLEDLLSGEQGGNDSCQETYDPSLDTHIRSMAKTGWKARNDSEGLLMFGCTSTGCFNQKRAGLDVFPDTATLADMKGWKRDSAATMRVLTQIKGTSVQYWIRSSADGRFVGFGGSPSGIIDLQALLGATPTNRTISINALYDPGFFPDGSGFIFQGSRTGLCNMSILRDPSTTSVNFSEDACTLLSDTRIPLYQSIGASLDGADYLAATSSYQRDPGTVGGVGEHFPSEEETAESTNRLQLFPLAFDGESWVRKAGQTFSTPFEIDWGMSHSNKLLISRLQGEKDSLVRTLGFNLYRLNKGSDGSFAKTRVAQLCADGLKGDFSYDDRFFITYAYIHPDSWKELGYASASDPVFKDKLKKGTSNIVLVDLLEKKRVTITNMNANQFAFFPHFRSDGWIYFEGLDGATGKRSVIASDAAIRAAAAAPL